ncbi:TetR/AcrR family transcriptional regulator [Paenibacillus sp. FSL W7-1088]|uniref:TetR/AcrR family transcriptional regulator n=1 Tax=Paenibacillus sp. FSL W7-1088 TaxID=2921695 RepID=UPI0030EDB619
MGKREDIRIAALDLIIEEGIQSVTFPKIFKRANVGSSTFYNYYKNKEELVNELYKSVLMHMGEVIMTGYDPNLTVYERTKGILRHMVDYGLNYPKEILFLEGYSDSPYIDEEVRNMMNPAMIEIFAVIKEGQKQGIISEMNPMFCCHLIKGMVATSIRGYLGGKYPFGEEQIRQTLDACWRAIKV